jgi:methionyl-tRNA synthetase
VAKTSRKTFYITTPIYYVNDILHIGNAYTTIVADAISRFKRLAGYDVFFLTGSDEHGQKMEKAAAELGIKPIELADKNVKRTKALWKDLNIAYDYFIRTTEESHEKTVQRLFQRLVDKGDIYKGTYEGYYCISDEYFLSDDVPLEDSGKKICPDCGKLAGKLAEETYFFRLSAYQEKLLEHYKNNPGFIRPETRMNEVKSFVSQGLKDLSLTRTTVKWGIPILNDPKHTIYVWFDALNNYLTGIGYDWNMERYEKFWPATIHLIGKDILRFHAVYWPAFLMASRLPLPEIVFGHGWWMKDETKMSKSKGNTLDPYLILNTFGKDPLRYFLLRETPLEQDGNFSHEGFVHRVNSDLANDLGNLVQRTLTMVHNYFGGRIVDLADENEADVALRKALTSSKEKVYGHYDDYSLNRALEEIWVYLNAVNKYLAENEPWILAKDNSKRTRLGRVLFQATAAIRTIAFMVYPVMPESAAKIWEYLGEKRQITGTSFTELRFEDFEIFEGMQKPEPLFPRISLKDFLEDQVKAPAKAVKEEKMDIITFDEFKRMDLRVAEILEAQRVEGTDKLLKIIINLGNEKRQMVAGIAETYAPEDLVGKKLIVIINLKPAVIRGVESNAMLLAADLGGKAYIPFFVDDIPAGSQVS